MNALGAFIMFGSLWLIAAVVHRDLQQASQLRETDARRDVSREAKFISAVIGRPVLTLSPAERSQVRLLEVHGVIFRKHGKIRLRRKYLSALQHAIETGEMVERFKMAEAEKRNERPQAHALEVNCRCGLPHA